jgi:hypothetical protein
VTSWLIEEDMPRKKKKNGKKQRSNESKTCEMVVHMKNISTNSLSDK